MYCAARKKVITERYVGALSMCLWRITQARAVARLKPAEWRSPIIAKAARPEGFARGGFCR
jgi:hypothetical protein